MWTDAGALVRSNRVRTKSIRGKYGNVNVSLPTENDMGIRRNLLEFFQQIPGSYFRFANRSTNDDLHMYYVKVKERRMKTKRSVNAWFIYSTRDISMFKTLIFRRRPMIVERVIRREMI